MTKSTLCAISFAIAVYGGLAGAASAANIVDSSFETPAVGTGFAYQPLVPGATFTNGAGVQGNGSAWASPQHRMAIKPPFCRALVRVRSTST
jgi:hypothetical protein